MPPSLSKTPDNHSPSSERDDPRTDNTLDPLLEITNTGTKRILFIPGIIHTNPFVPNLDEWKSTLKNSFPDREILFLDQVPYFHLTSQKEIEAIINKGVEIVEDEKETVILAHSFGGLLSKTIISRSPKYNIKKLITMATPHTADWWGLVGMIRRKLQTPDIVDTPTYTFGGTKDWTVPYAFTATENSLHENHPFDHRDFLEPSVILEIRERIIQIISEE